MTDQTPPPTYTLTTTNTPSTITSQDTPLDKLGTTTRLASQEVVVAAPMSFTGSAQRLWKLTRGATDQPARFLVQTAVVCLLAVVWMLILCWYILFGIFLVPYRLIRRGSRKRKRQDLQHQEMLAAIAHQNDTSPRPGLGEGSREHQT